MKRRLKAIFILFALVVNVECDIFGELLLTVKHIHDKVEKISNEQIRTNEKVDQLKTELQKKVDKIGVEQVNISEKVDRLKSELHKKVDKISLQQVNTSEEVCQLKTKLNNLCSALYFDKVSPLGRLALSMSQIGSQLIINDIHNKCRIFEIEDFQ